jgi:hypothetical protein
LTLWGFQEIRHHSCISVILNLKVVQIVHAVYLYTLP